MPIFQRKSIMIKQVYKSSIPYKFPGDFFNIIYKHSKPYEIRCKKKILTCCQSSKSLENKAQSLNRYWFNYNLLDNKFLSYKKQDFLDCNDPKLDVFTKTLVNFNDYKRLEFKKTYAMFLGNFYSLSLKDKKLLLTLSSVDIKESDIHQVLLYEYFQTLRFNGFFDKLIFQNFNIGKKKLHKLSPITRNFNSVKDYFYMNLLTLCNSFAQFYNYYSKEDMQFFDYCILKEFANYFEFYAEHNFSKGKKAQLHQTLNFLSLIEFYYYLKLKYSPSFLQNKIYKPTSITIHIKKSIILDYFKTLIPDWNFDYPYMHFMIAFATELSSIPMEKFSNVISQDLIIKNNSLIMQGNDGFYLNFNEIYKNKLRNEYFKIEFTHLHKIDTSYSDQIIKNIFSCNPSVIAQSYYGALGYVSTFQYNKDYSRDLILVNLLKKYIKQIIYNPNKTNLNRILNIFSLFKIMTTCNLSNFNTDSFINYYIQFLRSKDKFYVSLKQGLTEKQYLKMFDEMKHLNKRIRKSQTIINEYKFKAYVSSKGNKQITNELKKNVFNKSYFLKISHNNILKNHLNSSQYSRLKKSRMTFRNSKIINTTQNQGIHLLDDSCKTYNRETFDKNYFNLSIFIDVLKKLYFTTTPDKVNVKFLNKALKRYRGYFKNKFCINRSPSVLNDYSSLVSGNRLFKTNVVNLIRHLTLDKKLFLDYFLSFQYFYLNYLKIISDYSSEFPSSLSKNLHIFLFFLLARAYRRIWHLPAMNYLRFREHYIQYLNFDLVSATNPSYYTFDNFIQNYKNNRKTNLTNYYLARKALNRTLMICLKFFFIEKNFKKSFRYLISILYIGNGHKISLNITKSYRNKLLFVLKSYFRNSSGKKIHKACLAAKVFDLNINELKYILSKKILLNEL
mmetsp:Transcript_14759/g.20685  ORF Transcript_14759/g.20685 Transcript_14759/m.20685 type:complete len:896 (+) Transcript_14759:711-3398(+)